MKWAGNETRIREIRNAYTILTVKTEMEETTTVEPMAHVPEVTREKIFLARSIHCCPKYFPNQPPYVMKIY
jgi:hypothetical protein